MKKDYDEGIRRGNSKVEKLLYCEKCGDFVPTRIQKKCETLKVKGIDITLEVDSCVCINCGEVAFSPDIDEASLKQFYREYRKRSGLLQPEEIREIRRMYDLSQEAFARVLGLGAKTIARYENGSLQDEAQNNLIFLMQDRRNMKKLLELHPERLSEHERSAIAIQMDYTASVSYSDDNTNIIDIDKYRHEKGDDSHYANEVYESGNDLLSLRNQSEFCG